MNTSGEAADQVVRMTLEGAEVLIKLTGSGAKNAAVLLYSILREQKKTKGAARLSNMLRSGKPLKVYTFKDRDLKKFKDVAKEYGVLYTVLKDKNKSDDIFDVLVRAEDESKINRIVERFKLSQVDTATLRAEILKEKEEQEKSEGESKESQEKTDGEPEQSDTSDVPEPPKATDTKDAPELEHLQKSPEEIIIEEIRGKESGKEVNTNQNPTLARTESPEEKTSVSEAELPNLSDRELSKDQATVSLSEPSSPTANASEKREKQNQNKKSVRKKMDEIKARRAVEKMNQPSAQLGAKDKTPKTKER